MRIIRAVRLFSHRFSSVSLSCTPNWCIKYTFAMRRRAQERVIPRRVEDVLATKCMKCEQRIFWSSAKYWCIQCYTLENKPTHIQQLFFDEHTDTNANSRTRPAYVCYVHIFSKQNTYFNCAVIATQCSGIRAPATTTTAPSPIKEGAAIGRLSRR